MELSWTEVESSNIKALALKDGNLYVRFLKGGTYEYTGVSESTFQELVSAESVGSSFHKLIKSHPDTYPYRKMD